MENYNDLEMAKRKNLQAIIDAGIDPYPKKYEVTHETSDIFKQEEKLIADETKLTIAGRLMASRLMGKTAFGQIQDETGKIQVYLRKDALGEELFDLYKKHIDIGDIIGVEGIVFKTRTGETTIKAASFTLLCKSIRPIPIVKETKNEDGSVTRHDVFTDKETRYRKRYLDLICNPEVRDTFKLRSKLLTSFRHYLDNKGFMEVETPVLQPLYGGAAAAPFITHHNKLDMPLYLRIADELYLKRLIVGGYNKVYEVCKDFRNEGMDKTHNPEFTQIELYQAYADYNDMMNLFEEMVVTSAEKILGTTKVEYQGDTLDLGRPWRKAPMFDLIKEYAKIDISDLDLDKIRKFCDDSEIELPKKADLGKMIDEISKKFVEPNLIQPTFVIDYPKEISPLAKVKETGGTIVERFEPFIAGFEVGNSFTELNDPIDQRERLESQAALRDMGFEEANVMDDDFLEAIEIGMPPTGGLGIGFDRIAMIFTNSFSIRDVLFFPQMRPKK